MLPRRNRLTSAQFERAFGQSQVVRHPLVQARAHRRGDNSGEVRAAFVVPKKQGKAHDRNRTKRRLRERFRLHPRRDSVTLQGCDLIFMATPATATATLPELDAALDEVLRRLGKRMNPAPNPSSQNSEQSEHVAPSLAASQRPVASDEPVEENLQGEPPTESAGPGIKFREAPVSWLFIETIRFYQRAISPGLPPTCRFFPTCSAYTATAIERHGPFWGVVLGAWRICRCTPLCKGGFDPVPDALSPRFSSPFLGLFPKK